MEFTEREPLYRVISDGEEFYVRAKSFAEAEAKFNAWDTTEEHDPACIDAIMPAGSLIIEGKTRQQ